MNENAKIVIFKVLNVGIYVLSVGKFSKSGKCAGVKKFTNIMSGMQGINDHDQNQNNQNYNCDFF